MPTISEPRLLTWAIPTPQGLWYRAVVVIDRGVFVTPRVDVTTLEALKTASAEGTTELVKALTEHGRSKRPDYVAWESITAIRQNSSVGEIEIEADEKVISFTIPDRERMDKIGRALALTWNSNAPLPED